MTASTTIRLDNLSQPVVHIRELTMGEMRDMLSSRARMAEGPVDSLQLLTLDDGIMVSDLEYLTDLDDESQRELTEANITRIVEESKRLNPRFFGRILGMLSRFAELSSPEESQSSSEMSSD